MPAVISGGLFLGHSKKGTYNKDNKYIDMVFNTGSKK